MNPVYKAIIILTVTLTVRMVKRKPPLIKRIMQISKEAVAVTIATHDINKSLRTNSRTDTEYSNKIQMKNNNNNNKYIHKNAQLTEFKFKDKRVIFSLLLCCML